MDTARARADNFIRVFLLHRPRGVYNIKIRVGIPYAETPPPLHAVYVRIIYMRIL